MDEATSECNKTDANSKASKESVLDKIRSLTSHKHIKLTNCCNSAIFLSMVIARNLGKKRILIPDQGGWLTYKTLPPIVGLDIVEIKTDFGIIDLDDLKTHTKEDSCLIIASLAGYIAAQPLKEIADICRKSKCLLIEDASGAIGMHGKDPDARNAALCDGDLSDIIVASFGKWKPVNALYGGFISVNDKSILELDPELFMMTHYHESHLASLMIELDRLPSRLSFLQDKCKNIKDGLKTLGLGERIVHPDSNGLNVVALFETPAEKEKIINYCRQESLEWTSCPRYIRVNKNAISIEVKRLR